MRIFSFLAWRQFGVAEYFCRFSKVFVWDFAVFPECLETVLKFLFDGLRWIFEAVLIVF